jgi:hypothetical protein
MSGIATFFGGGLTAYMLALPNWKLRRKQYVAWIGYVLVGLFATNALATWIAPPGTKGLPTRCEQVLSRSMCGQVSK